MNCRTCELVARRDVREAPPWDVIWRGAYWDLVHCYGTSIEGWLVLAARRHISTIAEMTPAEAEEMGRMLRDVSRAMAEAVGCVKTYVVQFAEHPQHPHVHFHIIPRMANQPQALRSMRVFEQLGVAPEDAVSEERMNAIAQRIRRALEEQKGDNFTLRAA